MMSHRRYFGSEEALPDASVSSYHREQLEDDQEQAEGEMKKDAEESEEKESEETEYEGFIEETAATRESAAVGSKVGDMLGMQEEAPATSKPTASPAASPSEAMSRNTVRSQLLAGVQERHLTKREPEVRQWIQKSQADVFFGVVIMLQAVSMGVETELRLNSTSGDLSTLADTILLVLEAIFTFIYLIELCLRLRAEGWFFVSWRNPFGIFDTFLVICAVADVVLGMVKQVPALRFIASMRVLRILRLGRLVRLLHLFPELRLLVSGLAKTFRAAFWAILMLFMLCYCGALFCAELLGDSDDADLKFFFGSIPRSILTHVKLAMVEAWPDISEPMMKSNDLWRYYAVVFICVANIQLLNVVTGVVCEQVISTAQSAPPPDHMNLDWEKRTLTRDMKRQYTACGSGTSIEDYLELLKTMEVREVLKDQSVCLPLERKQLLYFLDEENNKKLSFEDFIDALMRLKGSPGEHEQIYHALRYDIGMSQRHAFKYMKDFERSMQKHIYETIDEPGRQLFKQARITADTVTEIDKLLSDDHLGKAEKADLEDETVEELNSACAELKASIEGFDVSLANANATINSLVQRAQRRSEGCDAATQTDKLVDLNLAIGEAQNEESRPAEDALCEQRAALEFPLLEVPAERQEFGEPSSSLEVLSEPRPKVLDCSIMPPSLLEVPSEPRPKVPVACNSLKDGSLHQGMQPETIDISVSSPSASTTADNKTSLVRPVRPVRFENVPNVPTLQSLASARKARPGMRPNAESPREGRQFLSRLAKGQLDESDINRLASKAPRLSQRLLINDRAGTSSLDPVSLAKRRRCLVKLAGTKGSVAPSHQRPS